MKITFPIIFCLFLIKISAQDTFSIIAVDQETGEVGSAGASCINGSIIISDVHPGVGAIHTQSYWNAQNQNNASQLMDQGYSPMFIIQYLIENDSQDNPTIRQYGIVDMVEGGRSAAYTGENCYDYKDHILGDTYSIQGNILLSPEILIQMENNFINTEGSLSDKLMAAMQGANIPGADTRCLEDNISSLSSFIRLAKFNDSPNDVYLDLRVYNTFGNSEPIDSLQTLYNQWIIDSISFDLGDINQDQIIDILDVVQLINFILGQTTFNFEELYLADCNSDSTINIQDIVIIVNYIINI